MQVYSESVQHRWVQYWTLTDHRISVVSCSLLSFSPISTLAQSQYVTTRKVIANTECTVNCGETATIMIRFRN